MKIAVISDIHGNMEAIEAVEKDIYENKCDKIFVLGDYAMAGPEPKEAVEYFMKMQNNSNIVMIQGNTDLMISDYSIETYDLLKPKAPIMADALRDDERLLNSAEKKFLKNLPIQKEISLEGVRFLLVHGSPRKNNEDILPNMTVNEIEKIIKNVDADVILCGHTHIPCGFQTSTRQTVVNAGSIGRPFTPEPKSCYLTISIEDGKCVFEHHFVDYNKESAAAKLKRRNFWGADRLAEMLLNPQERHF